MAITINGTDGLTSDNGALKLDGTTLVVDDTNNRVGIGTASPSGTLTVNNASATDYTVFQTSGSTKGVLGDESGNFIVKSASSLLLQTNGSERARITTDGYFRLAGGGIQFNGDTSAANALDDYEEGNWTPTLAGSSADPTGVTYGTRNGVYVKIGRMVSLSGIISFTTYTGGSGNIRISGIPFNASGNGTGIGAALIEYITLSSGYTTPTIRALNGNSSLEAMEVGSNKSWNNLPFTAAASSATEKYFQFTVVYQIA